MTDTAVETTSVDEQTETVDASKYEALKARLEELEAAQPPKREIDYEWPAPTPEQVGRNIIGGEAAVRVVKVTYSDQSKQFWDNHGVKTVHIGQFRYPRGGKQWDQPRLVMELAKDGLVLIEEAFPEAKHLCEINNCW